MANDKRWSNRIFETSISGSRSHKRANGSYLEDSERLISISGSNSTLACVMKGLEMIISGSHRKRGMDPLKSRVNFENFYSFALSGRVALVGYVMTVIILSISQPKKTIEGLHALVR
jgi:hypothetical protein